MEKNKINILIIDDDKSILQIITRILKKQGYETDTAETGEEALEKINNHSYDLAIIDIKLPDIEGVELLKKINLINSKTIKIMLTGFPSIEDGIKTLENGAAAYLVKPIKPEELIKIIDERLHKK